MVTVDLTEYKGWKDCVKVSNGIVELIATTQVGPRIIRFGLVDGDNEFAEVEEQLGTTGSDEWQIYGGHRLWHSPEIEGRTDLPDNSFVPYTLLKNGVILSQNTEKETGIKKTMCVTMSGSGEVNITHTLTNEALWDVELAPWAISVTATGGLQVMPAPDTYKQFLPNRTITLWTYTKMNDARINWGDKYMFLKQDVHCDGPFKFGYPNIHGWAASFNHNNMFVKRHQHKTDCIYPDFNCSYETYTCDYMMELETLGPLVTLAPGQSVDHIESWALFSNVNPPQSENEMDAIVYKYIINRGAK